MEKITNVKIEASTFQPYLSLPTGFLVSLGWQNNEKIKLSTIDGKLVIEKVIKEAKTA